VRRLENLDGKLSAFINCSVVLAMRTAFADDYDAFCFIAPLLLVERSMLMQTLTTFCRLPTDCLFLGGYSFLSIRLSRSVCVSYLGH
jgi:hypothetical protein